MPTKQPIADRIERHVELTPFGCWQWTGARDRDGYGLIKVDRMPRPAHRLAYAEFAGPIAPGMQIDHLCRNRACVNPDHLEQVTTKVNTRRGIRVTRLACPNGHARTAENLYAAPDGNRACRACHRAADDRYKAQQIASPTP